LRILVLNCGSSSLKFELIELDGSHADGRAVARGMADRIGPDAHLTVNRGDSVVADRQVSVAGHAEAAALALDSLGADLKLDAVAHRIVHGGESVVAPCIANPEVLAALEEASRFAPLHNPPALATLRAMQQRFPRLPMIVVADTAYHRYLPPEARTYAIPRELADRHGIRRFGFHGVGHAWMMERYAALNGQTPETVNLITLQLGAGCSAAAIRGGVSVDTSMGLTPLEGLMMATRSGDLDPAIVSYLARAEKISAGQVEHLLNHQSGLLGVSGRKDMRELEQAAGSDEQAALALEMFTYRVRKYIGAYVAVLGRVEAVIFGGGIGEHSVTMRERICRGLEALGISLDLARNRANESGEWRISTDQSPIALWVIPLNEELYIARAAARLLEATAAT
jgi:acetate kinase